MWLSVKVLGAQTRRIEFRSPGPTQMLAGWGAPPVISASAPRASFLGIPGKRLCLKRVRWKSNQGRVSASVLGLYMHMLIYM